MTASSAVWHASCVALGRHGVLITGASGRGKSALAFELMARGAELVADDQTALTLEAGALIARPVPGLAGLIEARGIGVLNAPFREAVLVTLAVDLDARESDRIPPPRTVTILGQTVECLRHVDAPAFSAQLAHYLMHGKAKV